MNVLSVSYPLAPVSPGTAGGAEQVLSMLDEALVAAGHGSIVIAPAGSQCRGTLLPIMPPGASLDDQRHAFARAETRAAIRTALRRFPIDLIHMHGLDFVDYLPEAGHPVIVTLHLPPSWYPRAAFHLQRPDTYLVCVSESQRRECPPESQIHAIVPNGVRLPKIERASQKGGYVVALGRICPEKGFHIAIDAATRAGIPLVIAGMVFGYRAHRDYFDNVLSPKLNGVHRFIGPVEGARKEQLLAGARCVLIPSLVSETSSLIAMEAAACGTPAVAFRRGALPEIIVDGETGYLVDTPDQMADAIRAARELSPSRCREYAFAHFSSHTMISRYFDLYESLITTQVLSAQKVA